MADDRKVSELKRQAAQARADGDVKTAEKFEKDLAKEQGQEETAAPAREEG